MNEDDKRRHEQLTMSLGALTVAIRELTAEIKELKAQLQGAERRGDRP